MSLLQLPLQRTRQSELLGQIGWLEQIDWLKLITWLGFGLFGVFFWVGLAKFII